ncbi:MAG TPA: type II toxin-antitoxin system VapC family toxin [Candidatus Sulfotelmatobacter sp.]|nr:type II toxin-antitoxin system VapC family toxin [Candidatus Sulfotelmatobacter sp.]
MNFLLDTNVVSEPMKVRPNAGVLSWLAQVDEDSVFLSVVTMTELRYGIERLATGKCRDRLEGWLRKDLTSRFGERILPVDLEIADACGRLIARSETVGRPMEARDAFIAATAEVRGLTLVTRNVSDFEATVKDIVTPWK